MTLRLAKEHLVHGRLRLAGAAAMNLLASDSATAAASLLLQIRFEQGWMGDVAQLARERFLVAFPATHHDRAAALRMHVAHVVAGGAPAEALRPMYAIQEAARNAADLRLQALALELIGKTSLIALRLGESAEPAHIFHALYRRAIELHRHLGDHEAAIGTALHLASAIAADDSHEAAALLRAAVSEAAALGRPHLVLQARLKILALDQDLPAEEVEEIASEAARLDLPLMRARALARRVNRQLDHGNFDADAVKSIAAMFEAERSRIDLHELWRDVARKTYALGHFAAAIAAARESVAAAVAIPFPYGEIGARTILSAALQEHGELLQSAVEDETIRMSPPQHRPRLRMNELLSAGFLTHVKQSERAARRAAAVADQLQPGNPADWSAALHYLAIANVDLGRWEIVLAALEKSIAGDEAGGDWLGAASKRIELATWRVKAHWRRDRFIPPEVLEKALHELEADEQRLTSARTPEAERVLMFLHQARSMAFQAAGRTAKALESLVVFGAMAERLGSRVHIRNFHTQAGLILHELAQRGHAAAATIAQPHLDEALRQWKETASADKIANAAYLAAANERLLSRRDPAGAAQHLARARELLHEADRHIAQLQMQYVEPGAEAAQNARIALHGQWSKVYELAVELSLVDLNDAAEAFTWVEKWKGRAFAVALGIRRLPVPAGLPNDILDAERAALEALTHAGTFRDLAEARDRLLGVWAELAMIPGAAEYADLRAGRAVSFGELAALLAEEERCLP